MATDGTVVFPSYVKATKHGFGQKSHLYNAAYIPYEFKTILSHKNLGDMQKLCQASK